MAIIECPACGHHVNLTVASRDARPKLRDHWATKFLDEHVAKVAGARTACADAYGAYVEWLDTQSLDGVAVTPKMLGIMLKERGFVTQAGRGRRVYLQLQII
jgi:hypothetical protein